MERVPRRTGMFRALRAASVSGLAGWAAVALATPPVDVTVSAADFNGDGEVTIADYYIQNGNDGITESDFWCSTYLGFDAHLCQRQGDANRDGVVDSADYAIWLGTLTDTDPAIPEIDSSHGTVGFSGGPSDILVEDTAYVIPGRTYTIMDGSGISISSGDVWHDYYSGALPPTITVDDSRADGFDLEVVYDNSLGSSAETYGTIMIGAFEFTDGPYLRQFFTTDVEVECPSAECGYKAFYPQSKYSPTLTLRGTIESQESAYSTREYIIGVSVQYPLLEYQHGVNFWLKESSGKYWLEMSFNDDFDGGVGFEDPNGDIPAYSTRKYIVSVRYMPTDEAPTGIFDPTHPNDYLYLFQEYRRYFKRMYGDVRYTRDPRPVNGYLVGGAIDTPGWGFNVPDLALDYGDEPECDVPPAYPCYDEADMGWLGWISRFTNAEDRGFDRLMLWAPSGTAYDDPGVGGHPANYPYQFTTNWDTVAGSDPGHPIIDTQDEMKTWAEYGDREVGLWWGNSSRPVAFGTTDSPSLHTMDTCSGTDLGYADDEMGDEGYDTGVYAIGTRAVGLDALSLMRPADAYVWVRALAEQHPNIRFVSEPYSFDILHTVCATFEQAYYLDDQCHVTSANSMADFLNKGHETWGQIFWFNETTLCSEDEPEIEDWDELDFDEQVKELMSRLAARGFVPVICLGPSHEDGTYGGCEDIARFHYGFQAVDGPNLKEGGDAYDEADFEAVDTWTETVPSGLQD